MEYISMMYTTYYLNHFHFWDILPIHRIWVACLDPNHKKRKSQLSDLLALGHNLILCPRASKLLCMLYELTDLML